MNNNYLAYSSTIGEHLQKRRSDLQLTQKQVAKIIGVKTDSITYWEKKRSEPMVQFYGKIIQFLGYNPFEFEIMTFGDKIRHYRYPNSLSQKKLVRLFDVDPTIIKKLEENWSKNQIESDQKILKYFNPILLENHFFGL